MSSCYGKLLRLSIFGQSHSAAIGMSLDGLPTGEAVDIGPMTRGAYAWIKVNDVADWEQKMIDVGVIHHGVLIHDPKVADALAMFCKFMGIEAVRGA